MKRIFAVLVGMAVAGLLAAAYLLAPQPYDTCVTASGSKFSAVFHEALVREAGRHLDMADVANFPWDTLLVFPAYTSGETIERRTGNPYVGHEYVPEIETLFSFVLQGEEVCRLSWVGWIDAGQNQYEFPRDVAKFLVDMKSNASTRLVPDRMTSR